MQYCSGTLENILVYTLELVCKLILLLILNIYIYITIVSVRVRLNALGFFGSVLGNSVAAFNVTRGLILGRGFVPVPSSFTVKSLGLGVRELKFRVLVMGYEN